MSVTIKPVSPSGPGVVFEQTDYEGDAGGDGGWESIARPRRPSAAAWVGSTERTLALPLELNGIDALGPGSDRPIGDVVGRVRAWGAKSSTGQPPILQVAGVIRVSPDDQWVLQSIEWGPWEANANGALVRQELTLNLLLFVEAQLVKGPAKKSRIRKGKKDDSKSKSGGKKKRRNG